MSFNTQRTVDIAEQENVENKVISSQNSDSNSSSKRNVKVDTKEKAKPFQNYVSKSQSHVKIAISNQDEIIDKEHENTLLIHAVQYGLEDLKVRLEETLKYALSEDFREDAVAEYILFEKEEEIKRLEKIVVELKQEIS